MSLVHTLMDIPVTERAASACPLSEGAGCLTIKSYEVKGQRRVEAGK